MKRLKIMSLVIVSSFLISPAFAAEKKTLKPVPVKTTPAAGPVATDVIPTDPRTLTFAELNENDQEILRNGKMSSGTYIAGGVVGTLVGFGIGHAVQSRYNKGWIFTVGEVGSIALIFAGLSCTTATSTVLSTCTVNGLSYAGIIGALGFRIWELVDLWATPASNNDRYDHLKEKVRDADKYGFKLRPILAPLDQGFYAGVGVKF